MKRKLSYLFAVIILISVGCNKYEFGPSVSIKTKKARIVNIWKIDYAKDLEDNSDITSDYSGEVWEFTKDETFLENNELKGKWSFSDDKEQIIINFTNGDVDVYRILRLKESELWIEESGSEEIHLTPY